MIHINLRTVSSNGLKMAKEVSIEANGQFCATWLSEKNSDSPLNLTLRNDL